MRIPDATQGPNLQYGQASQTLWPGRLVLLCAPMSLLLAQHGWATNAV